MHHYIHAWALAVPLSLMTTALPAQVIIEESNGYTNYSTAGNLRPTQNPGCILMADAGQALTPADLALGIQECFAAQDMDTAAGMIILLLARTAYDSRRVSDRTAHQAGAMLLQTLGSALSEPEQLALRTALASVASYGSPGHLLVCETLNTLGYPDYYPAYMIQHGMNAFSNPEAVGLVEDFDPDAAWDWALTSFMHCPSDQE